MEVKRITDVGVLVHARLDFLAQDSHLATDFQDSLVIHLEKYFKEHVSKDDFLALAVMEKEEMVSIGFILIQSVPPGSFVPSGRVGTLLNILTYPRYQRKGYGTILLTALIEEARRLQLGFIDLHATEQGKKLYKNRGFTTIPYEAMRLKL